MKPLQEGPDKVHNNNKQISKYIISRELTKLFRIKMCGPNTLN
jgi:hypothetical protein